MTRTIVLEGLSGIAYGPFEDDQILQRWLDAQDHSEGEFNAWELRPPAGLPDAVLWRVCDNVTGYPVGIKTYDTREGAEYMCRGLNVQPGGRYGVEIRENGEWRRDL